MRACATGSGTRRSTCSRRAAARPSSSRTTRRRPCAWATGSPSCPRAASCNAARRRSSTDAPPAPSSPASWARWSGSRARSRVARCHPARSGPAPGSPRGSAAVVLIRPEGVVVENAIVNGSARARVLDARLLGRTSLIRMAVDGIAAPLHSRMPGDLLPDPGALVSVRLDCRRAHVFPLAEPELSDGAATPRRSPERGRS